MMKKNERLIKSLGGTGQVAALCNISDAAVSQWRHSGIPKARLDFFKAIRPDLFSKDEIRELKSRALKPKRNETEWTKIEKCW